MNIRTVRFTYRLFSIFLIASLLVTLALGVVPAARVQIAQAAPAHPSIPAAGTNYTNYLPLIRLPASTPTKTSTPTPTSTFTRTPTPTSTNASTRTHTPTPTSTNAPTQTRTPTPTLTNTSTPTRTPTPTQTPTQATGIANGDFEQAAAGWTLYSRNGYTGLIGTGDFFDSPDIKPRVDPHSGIYMARLGGFNYEINEIYQTVTLPNVTPLYLTFYYQIRGSSGSECTGYYGGLVQIYIGSQKVYESYICKYLDTTDWTRGAIDLSAIPGQTVPIIFHVESANYEANFLYLDDIAIGQTP